MAKRKTSLRTRLAILSVVVMAFVAVLGYSMIATGWQETRVAGRLELQAKIAGDLNTAAAHYAVERGLGASILGKLKEGKEIGDLKTKFAGRGRKGDAALDSAIAGTDEYLERLRRACWRASRSPTPA